MRLTLPHAAVELLMSRRGGKARGVPSIAVSPVTSAATARKFVQSRLLLPFSLSTFKLCGPEGTVDHGNLPVAT